MLESQRLFFHTKYMRREEQNVKDLLPSRYIERQADIFTTWKIVQGDGQKCQDSQILLDIQF